ncbi:hypothetical protein Sxan_56580 [Streptomyces xanthophaeus]|uniref:Uncharacterized protein n=1 Tax=Streptomyces xanthophaeus TaxID=67385 RepID=A0A919LL75_9ACTN|nr:hypothetical protein Sxan_56580 [Streptomyces xanthophaeus]
MFISAPENGETATASDRAARLVHCSKPGPEPPATPSPYRLAPPTAPADPDVIRSADAVSLRGSAV